MPGGASERGTSGGQAAEPPKFAAGTVESDDAEGEEEGFRIDGGEKEGGRKDEEVEDAPGGGFRIELESDEGGEEGEADEQ